MSNQFSSIWSDPGGIWTHNLNICEREATPPPCVIPCRYYCHLM